MKDLFLFIADLICQEYRIELFEFKSKSLYGNLSEARQLYCFVLHEMGYRNIDIARSLEFKPSRIHCLIKSGKANCVMPYFKEKCEILIDKCSSL